MKLRRAVTCSGLAMNLLVAAALAQRVVSIGPPRKQEVIFIVTRNEDSSFQLARLADTKVTLHRSEPDLLYSASLVELDDAHAVFRFEGVVPGDYKFEISVFGLKTVLHIPEESSRKVVYEVSIGRAISIVRISKPPLGAPK